MSLVYSILMVFCGTVKIGSAVFLGQEVIKKLVFFVLQYLFVTGECLPLLC